MKCCSRSTLGVVIGVINLVLYGLSTIGIIINLIQINTILQPNNEHFRVDPEQAKSFLKVTNTIMSVALVVCLIMIITSALLITGIVNRRHKLMAPWLILSAIGFVCSIVALVVRLIVFIIAGFPIGHIVTGFIIGCIVIGIQYLIIYKIYGLYKDIRAKYHEQPVQMVRGATQMAYHNSYPNQPDSGSYNGFHVVTNKN